MAVATETPKTARQEPPAVVASYELERHPIAQMLIDYDRDWSGMFMGNATHSSGDFVEKFSKYLPFSFGRNFNYPNGPLISRSTSTQTSAKNILVGESFPHTHVVLHANPQEWITSSIFRADGRFRILLLPGDLSQPDQMARARDFCDRVAVARKDDGTSLLYTRYPYPFISVSKSERVQGLNPDSFVHYRRHPKSLVELITISHSAKPADQVSVRFEDLPEVMRGQFDAECFGWDYECAFLGTRLEPVPECKGTAYERWGIDKNKGAVVVLRPDMHVGWVGAIENTDGLEGYFENLVQAF
ncbi:thioredoxin-like protein [Diaporthe sp. PMI_573]|nr:thioredoxin-like protein [Diaporthaceae sp. PMI_573]